QAPAPRTPTRTAERGVTGPTAYPMRAAGRADSAPRNETDFGTALAEVHAHNVMRATTERPPVEEPPPPPFIEHSDGYPRLHLDRPVDVRNIALTIMAVATVLGLLQYLQPILIPFVLGALL